jgi:hypothetical protein
MVQLYSLETYLNCEILNMAITYHNEQAELHAMFSTSKHPNEQ